MQVLAAPGLKVPMEDKPRNYITDTPPADAAGFTVPDTVYYQRRVIEGDLVMVPATPGSVSLVDEVKAPAKKSKGGA